MQDRVSLYPGRVKLTPVSGQTDVYDMVRADEPTQEGTALNKANLLADDTAAMLDLGERAVPNDAFARLAQFTKRLLVKEAITESTNWVAPTGIIGNEIHVLLFGGGGSGSTGGTNYPGGGGGGGHWSYQKHKVTAGESYDVVIGAGGVAPTAVNTVGTTGGTSSFGDVQTALGGNYPAVSKAYVGGNGGSGGGGAKSPSSSYPGNGGAGATDGGGGGGYLSTSAGTGGTYGGGGGAGGSTSNKVGATGGTYGGKGGDNGSSGAIPTTKIGASDAIPNELHPSVLGYIRDGGKPLMSGKVSTDNMVGGGGGAGAFSTGGNGGQHSGGGGGGFYGNGGSTYYNSSISSNTPGAGGGGGLFGNGGTVIAYTGGGGGGGFGDGGGYDGTTHTPAGYGAGGCGGVQSSTSNAQDGGSGICVIAYYVEATE